MKRSFFLKIFLLMSVLFLVYTLVFGSVVYASVYDYAVGEKQDLLLDNTKRIADMCAFRKENFSPTINELINNSIVGIVAATDAQVMITDARGTVDLASDQSMLHSTEDQIPGRIMEELRSGRTFTEVGNLDGMYVAEFYTVGVPITLSDGSMAGGAFMSARSNVMENLFFNMRRMIISSYIIISIISMVIGFFVIRHFMKPVTELSRAANEFAKGKFDTRVEVKSNDEIGDLSEAFNRMAQELSKMEENRSSFIANISHDLKTPMTTISGFIDGILDGTIPPERSDYYLDIVSQEVKRMSKMVKNLLDLSRFEAGEYKLNIVDFDLCSVAGAVLVSFEKAINEKNVYVEVHFERDHMIVRGDYDSIYQAIYNLVDNAVKFINRDGILTLTIGSTDKKGVFSIRNTGSTMNEQDMERIFNRFYKTDRSRGQDKTGVGLGLHIVKSTLLAHGEDITVSGAENDYVEFKFTLPLSDVMNTAPPTTDMME